MRARLVLALPILAWLAFAGCGGSSHADLCSTLDPPPPECALECDPQPNAPVTCPQGFHCTPDGTCGLQCTPGGGECGDAARCTDDGRCVPKDQCQGLECMQVDCAGGGTTSLSGIVYAPNGTLPLSGVTVYVPNGPVAPFSNQLECARCSDQISGDPLVKATTDTAGRFTLTDVPATSNVPVVIQVGRWRRQITVLNVPECVDTPVPGGDTRLPKNQTEGDIPRMALTTGNADALECLLRKVGLDDSEFTTAGGAGRVHLYTDNGATVGSEGRGTGQFDAGHGGQTFADATTLWSTTDELSHYDITFLSCEGAQHPETKPGTSLAAMKQYADLGGRVFASHWHNIWLDSAPAPWPSTITRVDLGDLLSITADVDQTFDRGSDLAQWLLNVGASTVLGKIDLNNAKHTVSAVDRNMADRWIYLDNTGDGEPSVQYLSFTTPLEQPREMRCGRVVFSDIHVAADDSDPAFSFPSGGCTTAVTDLTPQEKVLIFMIFDIASCIPDVIE